MFSFSLLIFFQWAISKIGLRPFAHNVMGPRRPLSQRQHSVNILVINKTVSGWKGNQFVMSSTFRQFPKFGIKLRSPSQPTRRHWIPSEATVLPPAKPVHLSHSAIHQCYSGSIFIFSFALIRGDIDARIAVGKQCQFKGTAMPSKPRLHSGIHPQQWRGGGKATKLVSVTRPHLNVYARGG